MGIRQVLKVFGIWLLCEDCWWISMSALLVQSRFVAMKVATWLIPPMLGPMIDEMGQGMDWGVRRLISDALRLQYGFC